METSKLSDYELDNIVDGSWKLTEIYCIGDNTKSDWIGINIVRDENNAIACGNFLIDGIDGIFWSTSDWIIKHLQTRLDQIFQEKIRSSSKIITEEWESILKSRGVR